MRSCLNTLDSLLHLISRWPMAVAVSEVFIGISHAWVLPRVCPAPAAPCDIGVPETHLMRMR